MYFKSYTTKATFSLNNATKLHANNTTKLNANNTTKLHANNTTKIHANNAREIPILLLRSTQLAFNFAVPQGVHRA